MSRDSRRFAEVGPDVFVARYAQWDVNVGLVVGGESALVVDTRASAQQGAEIVRDLARVGPAAGLPVAHVVNTHVHFDHTLGNIVFDEARIHAHELAAASFATATARIREAMVAEPQDCPEFGYTAQDLRDSLATPLRPPDSTFAHGLTLDLGGRQVRLRYGGRGHTDGDIAVEVTGSGVTFLGDLIEESGPPSYGEDCWPFDWPLTLRWHQSQLDTGSVLVPGHGKPVGQAFLGTQQEQASAVAMVLREWVESDLPVARALTRSDARLPWPVETLGSAIRRGYAQASGPRPSPSPSPSQ